MGILLNALSICALVCLWVWGYRDVKRAEEASRATHADCDADDALCDWRESNPDACIACSAEARKLVLRKIKTYEYFLATHPFLVDPSYRDHLVFLRTLLFKHNDGPPPPAKRNRPKNYSKKPLSARASLLLRENYFIN